MKTLKNGIKLSKNNFYAKCNACDAIYEADPSEFVDDILVKTNLNEYDINNLKLDYDHYERICNNCGYPIKFYSILTPKGKDNYKGSL